MPAFIDCRSGQQVGRNYITLTATTVYSDFDHVYCPVYTNPLTANLFAAVDFMHH